MTKGPSWPLSGLFNSCVQYCGNPGKIEDLQENLPKKNNLCWDSLAPCPTSLPSFDIGLFPWHPRPSKLQRFCHLHAETSWRHFAVLCKLKGVNGEGGEGQGQRTGNEHTWTTNFGDKSCRGKERESVTCDIQCIYLYTYTDYRHCDTIHKSYQILPNNMSAHCCSKFLLYVFSFLDHSGGSSPPLGSRMESAFALISSFFTSSKAWPFLETSWNDAKNVTTSTLPTEKQGNKGCARSFKSNSTKPRRKHLQGFLDWCDWTGGEVVSPACQHLHRAFMKCLGSNNNHEIPPWSTRNILKSSDRRKCHPEQTNTNQGLEKNLFDSWYLLAFEFYISHKHFGSFLCWDTTTKTLKKTTSERANELELLSHPLLRSFRSNLKFGWQLCCDDKGLGRDHLGHGTR